MTKIVNAYINCETGTWPNKSIRNFTLKNCLVGATIIVKNSDKEKWIYNGYGIAFDGNGTWSFGNGYARNVVIFGVDNNSSSFHTDNLKNNFLVLGEGDTFGINESPGALKKSLVLILLRQRQILLELHYSGDDSYLFVNREEI